VRHHLKPSKVDLIANRVGNPRLARTVEMGYGRTWIGSLDDLGSSDVGANNRGLHWMVDNLDSAAAGGIVVIVRMGGHRAVSMELLEVVGRMVADRRSFPEVGTGHEEVLCYRIHCYVLVGKGRRRLEQLAGHLGMIRGRWRK
jgi:hypothetical protein